MHKIDIPHMYVTTINVSLEVTRVSQPPARAWTLGAGNLIIRCHERPVRLWVQSAWPFVRAVRRSARLRRGTRE